MGWEQRGTIAKGEMQMKVLKKKKGKNIKKKVSRLGGTQMEFYLGIICRGDCISIWE